VFFVRYGAVQVPPFIQYLFIYLENLVKPSEMPRPLTLTGITAHTQKHFTSSHSSDKTPKHRIFLKKLWCEKKSAPKFFIG